MPTDSTPGAATRTARLILAGAILTALTFASLAGNVRVCAEQATGDKDKAQTALELCRAMQPTDAPFVATVLLALLLVGPEISEFSAFGVSVKRQVQQAKQEAKEAKEETRLVEARLMQQIAQVAQASASVGDIIIGGQVVERANRRLDEKASRDWRNTQTAGLLEAIGPVTPSNIADVRGDRPGSASDAADAVKAQRLIASWEQLGSVLGLPGTLSPRAAVLEPELRDRFLTVFREELEIVRAARNAVAHGAPLESELLDTAVEMADKLVALLRERPES